MTVIRRATKNDIEAVLGLWRQLVDYHAGLGSAFQASPEAEDVFRKFLKKGLKRSDVLVQVAQENDIEVCRVFVAKSNSASSGFWSGAGFQEHIAIMERDISEPPDGDRLR